MDSNAISKGILKALAISIGIFLLIYFLYQIQSVLMYIGLAAVNSLIGRPIVILLRRRLKLNNTLAVIITMFLFLGVLYGIIRMFIPLIVDEGRNLSLLDINLLQEKFQNLYSEIEAYFQLRTINIEQSILDSKFFENVDFSLIPSFLNTVIAGFGSFSIALFSVLFITFFFLKDSKLLENGLITIFPADKEMKIRHSYIVIKNLLSRYFVGLIFQILILFIIYTIGLLIIGVENAIVIAFLCALVNLVPYLGPLIGAFIMVLLTMTGNLGQSFSEVILPNTLSVLVVVGIGQLVDNFFSQPIIFSKSVKSHPLEIFLVIIIAGILFGITGLIIAVPAYTAVKVILKEFFSENRIVQKLTKGL